MSRFLSRVTKQGEDLFIRIPRDKRGEYGRLLTSKDKLVVSVEQLEY